MNDDTRALLRQGLHRRGTVRLAFAGDWKRWQAQSEADKKAAAEEAEIATPRLRHREGYE